MVEDAKIQRPGQAVRTFSTGATRSSLEGKYDYEGFLSPLVLERFARYMHKNRKQADGSLRDSDNWQKGMPLADYMKSKWRHFMHVWSCHRQILNNEAISVEDFEDSLCAELFNTMGYLHEWVKGMRP